MRERLMSIVISGREIGPLPESTLRAAFPKEFAEFDNGGYKLTAQDEEAIRRAMEEVDI